MAGALAHSFLASLSPSSLPAVLASSLLLLHLTHVASSFSPLRSILTVTLHRPYPFKAKARPSSCRVLSRAPARPSSPSASPPLALTMSTAVIAGMAAAAIGFGGTCAPATEKAEGGKDQPTKLGPFSSSLTLFIFASWFRPLCRPRGAAAEEREHSHSQGRAAGT